MGANAKNMKVDLAQQRSREEVTAYRFDIAELERGELDMAMLAQLHAVMNADELLTNSRGPTRPESRQCVTFTYMFKGKYIFREVCFPSQQ